MFEFKTSILLDKALKTLPSHFKFEQTIVCFFFSFILGAKKSKTQLDKSLDILICLCAKFKDLKMNENKLKYQRYLSSNE